MTHVLCDNEDCEYNLHRQDYNRCSRDVVFITEDGCDSFIELPEAVAKRLGKTKGA